MAFNIIGNMKLSGADSMIHEMGRVKHATEKMQRSVKGVGQTVPTDMRKAGGSAKITADQWTNAGTSITNASRNIATAAGVMTAALVGVVVGTVNVAKSYETAFAEVKKVVDETDDITYDDLMKSARDMSKEIPASFEEIATAMADAGRLGVDTANLEQFAKAAINMGVATNLSSEDAAQSMARFANIMDMPLDQVDKLGSAVVHLGNNFATSESEIMTMAQRLATAGKMTNMSESDVLALSAAMSNVGIAAERGGTAMSTTMYKISSAMKNGGEEAKGFAKVAGMSVDEFADAWENDAAGALNTFLAGLSDINDEGGNVEEILGNLGINAQRQKETISALALSHEDLADALDKSSEGFEDGTALADEASKRYETFDSKLTVFKNTLRDVAYLIGSVFADRLAALMDKLQPVIDKITEFTEDLIENNPELADSIANFILWAIAIGAVVTALATLGTIFGFIVTGIGQFKKLGEITKVFATIKGSKFIGWIGGLLAKLGKVTGISKLVGLLKSGFAALSGPIGWVVAAILGVIGVLTYLYNTNDKVKEKIDEVWSFIKSKGEEAFGAVVDFIEEQYDKLVGFWEENSETIKAAWANIWEYLNIVYETVIVPMFEALKRNMGGVKRYLQLIWDNISSAFAFAWEQMKATVAFAIDFILGWIKIFAELFSGDIAGALTAAKELFLTILTFIWETVKRIFGWIVDRITTNVQGAFDIVSEVFMSILDIVGTYLGATFEYIKETWKLIWDTFKGSLSDIYDSVVEWFAKYGYAVTEKMVKAKNNLVEGFKDWLSSTVEGMLEIKDSITGKWDEIIDWLKDIDLLQIGKDIVGGLTKGIKDTIGGVGDALKKGMNTGVDKFKSFLGINSPSKVFRGFGENINEGLAEGIYRKEDEAVRAITDVAAAVSSNFRPIIDNPAAGLTNRLQAATNSAASTYTASVTSSISTTKQPANINVRIGNSEFKRFIDDIDTGIKRQNSGTKPRPKVY